jgi:long-chain acyl-CoA synthetase
MQHPGVLEAAVVGVPDEMMGEAVGVVITPRPGTDPEPNEVRRFVSELLADYKVPEYVSLQADPLPRNPAGKITKALLRDRDWGPSLPRWHR